MLSADRFQRDRGPIHFSLGSVAISRRGWSEFRPRQVEIDKLITTLILNTSSVEDKITAMQAVVLTDDSPSVSKRARRFLWQRFPMLVLPYGIDLFWEMMFAVDQPMVLCHVASGSPDFDHGWIRAASLIAELDPRASWDFLQATVSKWDWSQGKPILFEALPGKTRLLELESRSEKAWEKTKKSFQKYSSLAIQDLNHQIFHRGGWGLNALTLDPSKHSISLQTRTIELEPDGYGLGFGKQVAKEIGQWTTQYNLPAINQIISTIPSLALNAELHRCLSATIQTPDIQFGWNPVQSVLNAIIAASPSTLMISLGPFPLINFVHIRGLHD